MDAAVKDAVCPSRRTSKLDKMDLEISSKLNLPFVVRLALGPAPPDVWKTFQSAFVSFAQVLSCQRHLSSLRFTCCVSNFGIETEDYLEEICTNLKFDRKQIDPDRIVWVEDKVLAKFLIGPGQWVNLCDVSSGHARKKEACGSLHEHSFTCQIFPLPQQRKQSQMQTILMNSVTEYNLRRTLNIPQYVPIPKLQLNPLVTNPAIKLTNKSLCFSPIHAKSVQLTRLKCSYDIVESECDILIRDAFLLNDKYLCVGDVISFPIHNDNASLDLVVTEINDKKTEDKNCTALFRISSDLTQLVVNTQELHNQFHVKPDLDKIKRLLPPCLEDCYSQMRDWIEQALVSATSHVKSDNNSNSKAYCWPNFLVHGPIGSGKATVCKTVAAYYGFNFHFINGVNFIGDTSAYTEGKFRALFDQIKSSMCPVFVYIKNLHLVGKDKDGNEDKRVILAFKEFLHDISCLSTTPTTGHNAITSNSVVMVGSTHCPQQLVSSIIQNFLFRLELPSVINSITETEATLRWFMKKVGTDLEDGTNLETWAKENCEGMKRSFGDLKALMSGIVRHAFSRITNSDSGSRVNNLTINTNDLDYGLKIIDEILKKAASSVEIPKVRWEDIGGMEEVKMELINSVRLPLEYPHLFAAGIRRSGILLYGPPGTGKTLIAKAVATEFKLSFLSVKGPELLNMYVGQSEQNVREVFSKARNASPCIIFFDELDALAPNRGRAGDSGGVMDRVVSQILAELDGTHSTPGVFIIGATNRPDLIDPALLRPGRFDKLLYVGINQDVEAKTSILKALTRRFRFSDNVDLANIASMLPNGMTGADMYSLCSDTYMIAVERHISDIGEDQSDLQNDDEIPDTGVLVNKSDFQIAISRATPSLSDGDQARYEELKKMKR